MKGVLKVILGLGLLVGFAIGLKTEVPAMKRYLKIERM
jgi:hypothetical protein